MKLSNLVFTMLMALVLVIGQEVWADGGKDTPPPKVQDKDQGKGSGKKDQDPAGIDDDEDYYLPGDDDGYLEEVCPDCVGHKKKLDRLQKKIKPLQDEQKKLENRIEKIEWDITAWQVLILSYMESENSEYPPEAPVQPEIDRLRERIAQAKAKLEELEGIAQKVNGDEEKLKNEIAKLREALRKCENDCAPTVCDICERQDKLRVSIDALEAEAVQTEDGGRYLELEQEIQDNKKKLKELEKKAPDCDTQCKDSKVGFYVPGTEQEDCGSQNASYAACGVMSGQTDVLVSAINTTKIDRLPDIVDTSVTLGQVLDAAAERTRDILIGAIGQMVPQVVSTGGFNPGPLNPDPEGRVSSITDRLVIMTAQPVDIFQEPVVAPAPQAPQVAIVTPAAAQRTPNRVPPNTGGGGRPNNQTSADSGQPDDQPKPEPRKNQPTSGNAAPPRPAADTITPPINNRSDSIDAPDRVSGFNTTTITVNPSNTFGVRATVRPTFSIASE